MPIIKCLGCNHDTNTATCDWVTHSDHKPRKCYIRYVGNQTIPGCGYYELPTTAPEKQFANTILQERGWPFTEYRKDLWPLCPCCGEEELYTGADIESLMGLTPQEKIRRCVNAGLRCYRCNWELPPKSIPTNPSTSNA